MQHEADGAARFYGRKPGSRNPYYVRIPRDRVEYGPYPNEANAKAFARIGSQYGSPREVYYAPRTGDRARKYRRYEAGRRVWPRANPRISGLPDWALPGLVDPYVAHPVSTRCDRCGLWTTSRGPVHTPFYCCLGCMEGRDHDVACTARDPRERLAPTGEW